MVTAKSLKDIEKQLECAVCLEQFQDPKVLLCLHTYCKKCLEKIQEKSGKGSVITCPECRMETEIHEGKLDSLPVNFFVNNIMSVMALHGESQTTTIECDNCDNGEPSSARCSVCSFFLCDFCAEGHRRGKQTKNHKLMSMEEVKSSDTVNVSHPAMCKEHEEEVLKLYCQTCEKAICRDCTMVEHRQHQYLFVKDAYSKEKETILELLKKTKTKQDDLKGAIAKVSKERASVEKAASGVKEDINAWINQLIASLEQQRKELHQSLNELLTSKAKELQIQQEHLEEAFSCLQSSIDFTERAFQDGSQVEVLEMKKQISERLSKLSCSTWKLEPSTYATLYFIPQKCLGDGVRRVGCVKDYLACAAKSTVRLGRAEDGVMYNLVCGQTRVFHIQARNSDGGCCVARVDDISVKIKAPTKTDFRNLELFESDPKGSGSYRFFYKPEAEGTFSMSVEIGGKNVHGSPFTWQAHHWELLEIQQRQIYYRKHRKTKTGMIPVQREAQQRFITLANAILISGRFSWKIQARSPLAVGVIEENNLQAHRNCNFSYRMYDNVAAVYQDTNGLLYDAYGKELPQWLWTIGSRKSVPAPGSDEKLNIYLDLDHKRLFIENPPSVSSAFETKGISGIVCPVSPLFRLDSPDSTVSLVQS